MGKALLQKRSHAIELRLTGKSYSEIKQALGVSKGTLSLWLRAYPLSHERIRMLRDWNAQRIERYRETRRRQRQEVLDEVFRVEKSRLLPISKRDVYIAGLFLYWGEGSKTPNATVALSNSNPTVIRFFLYWLHRAMGCDLGKVKIRLHCYSDMDAQEEIRFWSREIGIPKSQFRKPYIKESKRADITYKTGSFGHGTCNAIIGDAVLARRVRMGLRVFEEYHYRSGGIVGQ